MRNKRYSYGGRHLFVKQLNSDDLLDLDKSTHPKRPASWALLFGKKTEREGLKQAKDILHRMVKLMAEDMIVEHDCFVLPQRDFGYLHIADLKPYMDVSRIRRDLVLQPNVYGGVVKTRPWVRKVNGGKWYLFKMVGPLMARMRELRDQGHHW